MTTIFVFAGRTSIISHRRDWTHSRRAPRGSQGSPMATAAGMAPTAAKVNGSSGLTWKSIDIDVVILNIDS